MWALPHAHASDSQRSSWLGCLGVLGRSFFPGEQAKHAQAPGMPSPASGSLRVSALVSFAWVSNSVWEARETNIPACFSNPPGDEFPINNSGAGEVMLLWHITVK